MIHSAICDHLNKLQENDYTECCADCGETFLIMTESTPHRISNFWKTDKEKRLYYFRHTIDPMVSECCANKIKKLMRSSK